MNRRHDLTFRTVLIGAVLITWVSVMALAIIAVFVGIAMAFGGFGGY